MQMQLGVVVAVSSNNCHIVPCRPYIVDSSLDSTVDSIRVALALTLYAVAAVAAVDIVAVHVDNLDVVDIVDIVQLLLLVPLLLLLLLCDPYRRLR